MSPAPPGPARVYLFAFVAGSVAYVLGAAAAVYPPLDPVAAFYASLPAAAVAFAAVSFLFLRAHAAGVRRPAVWIAWTLWALACIGLAYATLVLVNGAADRGAPSYRTLEVARTFETGEGEDREHWAVLARRGVEVALRVTPEEHARIAGGKDRLRTAVHPGALRVEWAGEREFVAASDAAPGQAR